MNKKIVGAWSDNRWKGTSFYTEGAQPLPDEPDGFRDDAIIMNGIMAKSYCGIIIVKPIVALNDERSVATDAK